MTQDDRVVDLLVHFEEQREQGQDLSPEELCRDCPELLPKVLLALRAVACIPDPSPNAADTRSGGTHVDTDHGEGPSGPASPGQLGRFTILRSHAKGGLGEVLVAEDEELHRQVAFKRMLPKSARSADACRRFLMEAEITAKLEHPGIVPIYGLVHDDSGRPCYAMRFVQGESLRDGLEQFHKSRHPWDGREFRHLLQQFITVCQTVAYAHSRGIIHRDLKPSNVMLGKYGETLVVDWGLAKPFGRTEVERSSGEQSLALPGSDNGDRTLMGQTIGTPAYMSPEQAAGRWNIVGPASDVYSLGATLYELLTGERPVQGDDLYEMLARVQRGEFPRPRQLRPDVPKALEAVCLKAMALKPEGRYATAKALADDVERWLADEPVSAYAEPLLARANRWARRRRALVVSGMVAALLVSIGAAVGYRLREEGKRKQEEQRYARLTDLRFSAEANERLALDELKAGHYKPAKLILADTMARISSEPQLRDVAERLESHHAEVSRLVEFYRLSDRAQFLEMRLDDDGAIRACRLALAQVDVWNREKWWEGLPAASRMHPAQLTKYSDDIHQQLLFLAYLHAKTGFMRLGDPNAKKVFHTALEVQLKARAYRETHTARLVELLCALGLGDKEKERPLPPAEPVDVTDLYFLGVLHFMVANLPKNDFVVQLVLGRVRGLTGFDDTKIQDRRRALEQAAQYLQRAANLDPQHPWIHHWLAFCLLNLGKLEAAEAALSAQVSLRPEEPMAYRLRARAALLGIDLRKDPWDKAQCLKRGLRDLEKAAALDRIEPEMGVEMLELFNSFGREPEALAMAEHLLETIAPLRTLQGWNRIAYQRSVDGIVADNLNWARSDQRVRTRAAMALAFTYLERAKEAQTLADGILKEEPDHPRAWQVRGQLQLAVKQSREALASFERARARLPDNFAVAWGIAEAQEQLQDWPAALAGYDRALSVAEVYWQKREAHLGRARALHQLDRADEADRARAAADEVAYALPSVRPKVSEAPLTEREEGSVELPGGASLRPLYALVHVLRGNDFFARKLAAEADIQQRRSKNDSSARQLAAQADEEWRIALAMAPDYAYPYALRAEFWASRNEWEKARQDYDQAVRLDPLDANIRYQRAITCTHLGQDQAALADLSEAIQLDGRLHAALDRRSAIYSAAGDYVRASADLDRAVAIMTKIAGDLANEAGADHPRLREFNKTLADYLANRAHVRLQLRQPAKALEDAQSGLRLAPDHASLREHLVGAYALQSSWPQASAEARKLAGLRGDDPYSWYLLALVRLASGDRAGFRDTSQVMQERFRGTDDARAADYVAWVAVLGNEGPALKLAEAAAKLSPPSPNGRFAVAAALCRAGKYEECIPKLKATLAARRPGEAAYEWPLLAIAYQRLGRAAEAKEALERARAELKADDAWTPADPPRRRINWRMRVQCDLLLREAEAALAAPRG